MALRRVLVLLFVEMISRMCRVQKRWIDEKKCNIRSGASLFDCHKTCSIKTYVLGTSLDAKGGATAFS